MVDRLFSLIGALFKMVGVLLLKLLPSRETLGKMAASHAFKVTASACVAVGCVCLSLFLIQRHLGAQERFRLDPSRINLTHAGVTWTSGTNAEEVTEQILADLQTRVAGFEETSAFDVDVLEAVALKLQESPWVASVDRVERRFPAGERTSYLDISFSIRKPVLLVKYDSRCYLVDRDGCVLPRWFMVNDAGEALNESDRAFLQDIRKGLRLVTGITGSIPEIGKPWSANEQVMGALSLERELRLAGMDELFRIDRMDMTGIGPVAATKHDPKYSPGAGVRLFVTTAAGTCEICWGKAPLHSTSVEVSVAQKIQNLKTIYQRDPAFTKSQSYDLRLKA